MKILLSTVLILSFLGISILSFAAMYHGSYGDGPCATEMATGLNCPPSPFAFADFHLNLLQLISNADLGVFSSIYLALFSVLIFSLMFGTDKRFLNSGLGDWSKYNYRFQAFIPLVQSQTQNWLSRHENSPALS